jgi:glycerophosphoryl diester phosphodiesterase
MNTLPAFELALQQGADGIELDAHLSKDGAIMVLHDFTVDATTDGTGFAKDMTLAQLKELDASERFSATHKSVQIPTLDEVFEAVGKHLFINVEIKSITEDTDGVEQAVANCILRHGLEQSTIASSFNPYALQRFRRILPTVPIGYLYANDYTFFPEVMDTLPHEARHPHYSIIDDQYMQWARAHDYRVNTWTVNDSGEARRLHTLGVDALITDAPDKIIEALRA